MSLILDGTSGVTFPAGGSGNVAGSVVGTSDTQSLTNKSLNGASFGTVSGSAPLFLCRAWVNFNGTGTVAIRASGNVSSITDNATGYYTVNFTTAMPDADYASHVIASPVGIGAFVAVPQINITNVGQTESAPAAGSFRFVLLDEAFAGYRDCKYVNVSIFR